MTRSGSGSGTISSRRPAGIDCGNDCNGAYDQNTQITLMATPAPGSLFTGWSGDCTGTGPASVILSSAKSCDAGFTLSVIGTAAWSALNWHGSFAWFPTIAPF